MAAHYVTCVYCKERFNRDTEPTIQISERRYAHAECAKKYQVKKSQEEKDLEALEKYIMKLFNETFINAKIRKQIRDYRQEYNYTYSGMLKTLIFWFEIKGNSIEDSNYGIAIIPYVYKQASDYFYHLYLSKIVNQNKKIEDYKPKIKEIKISPPISKPKMIKLFNLNE